MVFTKNKSSVFQSTKNVARTSVGSSTFFKSLNRALTLLLWKVKNIYNSWWDFFNVAENNPK